MSTTKGIKTAKGRATETKGRADGGRGKMTDAALVRNILALAFPTPEERDDARKGVFMRGSIVEVIQDLAHDCLSIFIYHPEILPHALPVILRAARASVRRGGERGRDVRALLAKLESAAEKGGAE